MSQQVLLNDGTAEIEIWGAGGPGAEMCCCGGGILVIRWLC